MKSSAARARDCGFGLASRIGCGQSFVFVLWLTCIFFALEAVDEVQGQTVSREYPLKAVFLLNFAQFTEWPTNAFESATSPVVIGLLGDDPFGHLIDDAVQDETVNGRKFVVQRFHRLQEIETCHVLYISQSEAKRLGAIVASLNGRPVLTVSDIEGAAYRGVMVRFLTDHNKIHLRINTNALAQAKLGMSSKLLRVAEIVGTNPP